MKVAIAVLLIVPMCILMGWLVTFVINMFVSDPYTFTLIQYFVLGGSISIALNIIGMHRRRSNSK